jgi:hypothetical protein
MALLLRVSAATPVHKLRLQSTKGLAGDCEAAERLVDVLVRTVLSSESFVVDNGLYAARVAVKLCPMHPLLPASVSVLFSPLLLPL